MLLRRASVFFRKLRRTSCVATARDETIITSSPTSIISIPVSARSFRFYSTTKKFGTDDFCRIILLAQTALVFGIGSNPIIADDDRSANELMQDNNSKVEPYVSGLRRVEDGSIISNTHTVKWRLFTDNGRSLSLQGKFDDAEKQFILALQEAKEGFGERDPHVASSFNNLAEIYRVKKLFEKAEPLYLDAIQILEESFGPEDVRVGAALHNLGQFYLVQRKLDESKKCYERALKIKGRALGYASTDYADTMYHLGTVMNLLGNDRDSVTLIQDSIRILEEGGLGESMAFIRKMRYLSQILLQSNKPYEVENLQRKILHILEISKGWDAVETIVAAESLALTLQSLGNLVEARELIERCLSSKESILGGDHLQVASSKLYLAKNLILQSNNLSKVNLSEAEAELDKAKCTLNDSVRIPRIALDCQKDNRKNVLANNACKYSEKDKRAAFIILLQSLDAIGLLEITKLQIHPTGTCTFPVESEHALRECISFFSEPKFQKLLRFPDVRNEYLSSLRHLLNILGDYSQNETQNSRAVFDELKNEVKHIDDQLMGRT